MLGCNGEPYTYIPMFYSMCDVCFVKKENDNQFIVPPSLVSNGLKSV